MKIGNVKFKKGSGLIAKYALLTKMPNGKISISKILEAIPEANTFPRRSVYCACLSISISSKVRPRTPLKIGRAIAPYIKPNSNNATDTI